MKVNLFHVIIYRSSHSEVFLGKGVLKIWSKFTREHPCRRAISITCIFIEITFWHESSPVNLLHIFRTPFPMNTAGWLLLNAVYRHNQWTNFFMIGTSLMIVLKNEVLCNRCIVQRVKIKPLSIYLHQRLSHCPEPLQKDSLQKDTWKQMLATSSCICLQRVITIFHNFGKS